MTETKFKCSGCYETKAQNDGKKEENSETESENMGFEIKFYSAELARLDVHYDSFWKLYISHLLRLQPYPEFDGVFHFNGHPVTKVDILGIVVSRHERGKCYIYELDDGTGVIKVCQLKPKEDHNTNNENNQQLGELGRTLLSGIEGVIKNSHGGEFAYLDHGFELGDLLHVRGELKSYRECNEVFGNYVTRVTDPNAETLRMKECMDLYTNCYLKPVTIPDKIRLEAKGSSNEILKKLTQGIKHNLLETSANQTLVSVYMQDLIPLPELEKLTVNLERTQIMTCYRQAMEALESEGILYKDSTFDYQMYNQQFRWKIVSHDSQLHTDILNCLKQDRISKSKTGAEFKGSYYLTVLKLLIKKKNYEYLQQVSVQKCLELLEEQGKVYGGSYRGYYLPFEV